MIISEAVCQKINTILQLSFQCNAEADNFAYNLDFLNFNNISEYYHNNFAHAFPELADKITDFMKQINIRAIRLGLPNYTEAYQTLNAIFADNLSMIQNYRQHIKELIELADINNDYEVKIFFEEFYISTVKYEKQAQEWLIYSNKLTEGILEVNFKNVTHFLL